MRMLDLLRRCARLEIRAAEIYDVFARRFEADEELSGFWRTMAEDERRHAHKISTWRRLLTLERKLNNWEVAGFERDIRDLETLMRGLRGEARKAETADEAFAVALRLEQSELDPIYTQLLQSSPLARFPDLPDTQRAELGAHHRALLSMLRARSKDEKNVMGAVLLDVSDA